MSSNQAAPFLFDQPSTSSSYKKKKGKKKYYLMTPDEYTLIPDAHLPTSAVWEGLKERTTSHGIPQVDTAAGRVKRVVWIFVSLATIAALIYNLEENVKKFMKRDVVVVEFMYHLKQQQFPAVTFCNMNPFKKSNVENNAELSLILGTNRKNTAKKKKKKRRRKRFIAAPNCDARNIHSSGYCFALAAYHNTTVDGVETDWLYRQTWYDFSNVCADGWEFAELETEDKYNYVKNHPTLFAGQLVSTYYWLYGRYDISKGANFWQGTANKEITWGAWKSGYPIDNGCIYADINDNHKWTQGNCYSKYMTLCQKQEAVPTTQAVETTSSPVTTEAETTATTTIEQTTTQQITTQEQTTTQSPTTTPQQATTQQQTTTTQPLTTTKQQTTTQPLTTTQQQTSSQSPTTTQQETTTQSPTTTPQQTTTLQQTTAHQQTTQQTTTTTVKLTTTAEQTTEVHTTLPAIKTTHSETTIQTNPATTLPMTEIPVTSFAIESTSDLALLSTLLSSPALDSTVITNPETTVNPSAQTTYMLSSPSISVTNYKTAHHEDVTTIYPHTASTEDRVPPKTSSLSENTATSTSTNRQSSLSDTLSTNQKRSTQFQVAYTSNKDITTIKPSLTSETAPQNLVTDLVSTSLNGMQGSTESPSHSDITVETTTKIELVTDRKTSDAQTVVNTLPVGKSSSVTIKNALVASTNIPSNAYSTNLQKTDKPVVSDITSVDNTDEITLSLQSTTTTQVPEITTYNPPPIPPAKPVEGSQFPERVQTTEEFTEEEKTFEILADIDEQVKKSLGYTADEFIVDCQYAGFVCRPQEFSYFYNAVHGNCYTFNSGWNASQVVKWSHQAGPRYGLKVVLNIDQDEYIQKFGSEAAGVRVVIHSQAKMPFPEDEGTLARTGHLTSIGVTKMYIKKMGPPYTLCFRLSEKNLTRNIYEEHYNVNYTTLACYKTCYQRYVIQECGCADPGYPSKGEAFGNVNVKACNSSKILEDDCKYNITLQYALNKLDCTCEDPCEEDVYIPEMSEMFWPSDKAKEAFMRRHEQQIQAIVNSNDTNKFRDNLAKVEVYFNSFDLEVIEEKPSYTEIVFFVDIGGSMGLWIGWSLVTLFEFMEFFIDLIILAIAKRKSGKVGKEHITNSPTTSKPTVLPRRSLSYIHQDRTEMSTLKPPKTNLATLNESHRDSGISSASSMEDDRISVKSRSRRASRSRASYQNRRESIKPLELRRNNLMTPTFHQ